MTAPQIPLPPAPGLRERKKVATMRRVQETALDLIAARGFDAVTIEEIAAAAEVSPSTVYRYFGTKEGLVLHDEFDDRVLAGLSHYLGRGLSPWKAIEATFAVLEEEHFVIAEAPTRARLQLWFDIPSVRAAGLLTLDEMVEELAELAAAGGRWTFPQARIVVSAVLWPLIGAVKNWHDDDGGAPLSTHLAEAIAVLRATAPDLG